MTVNNLKATARIMRKLRKKIEIGEATECARVEKKREAVAIWTQKENK